MIRRIWGWIARPSTKWALGALVGAGVAIGVVGVVVFETALGMTSTEQFCSENCHEMTVNVAAEYKGTVHDVNRTGVRAKCSDCHVPKPFIPKMIRKMKASLELYHHFVGSLDTQEKFEQERLRMANNVWREMRATDSRECRYCHNSTKMNHEKQSAKAQEFHKNALDEGKTCIDCHKGVAHRLPKEVRDAAEQSTGQQQSDGGRVAAGGLRE